MIQLQVISGTGMERRHGEVIHVAKGFHLLLGRTQVMRRASKEPVKPPGVTFLIQCSGTVVKDM